jgi:hypothetical protein
MSEAVMDLEQYFERDIIEFLEKQKALQDSEERHTASEMLEALADSNVSLAAKLIEAAVLNYNKIPADNVYKEIHFRKLQDMLRQAGEFIRLHPQQSTLKEYVDLLRDSGQLGQGPVERVSALDGKFNEVEEQRLKAEEEEKIFRRALAEKFDASSAALAACIRKRDVAGAMQKYGELKSLFGQYPSLDLERKQEMYNDLLSFFMQIGKLRKDIMEQRRSESEERVRLARTVKAAASRYIRLEDIKATVARVKEDVRKGDFSSATQRTIELREMTGRIPESYRHIRSVLNSKIDIIVQRIEFVRRMKEHN